MKVKYGKKTVYELNNGWWQDIVVSFDDDRRETVLAGKYRVMIRKGRYRGRMYGQKCWWWHCEVHRLTDEGKLVRNKRPFTQTCNWSEATVSNLLWKMGIS